MHDFPSGQWVGFFTYSQRAGKHPMDLVLEFKGETVFGEGADGVGEFFIDGKYSESDGECWWAKTYVGRHSVDYRGFREEKGIWGTWVLPGDHGGFHIWPIGQEAEALASEVEEEKTMPALVELSPAHPPGASSE